MGGGGDKGSGTVDGTAGGVFPIDFVVVPHSSAGDGDLVVSTGAEILGVPGGDEVGRAVDYYLGVSAGGDDK